MVLEALHHERRKAGANGHVVEENPPHTAVAAPVGVDGLKEGVDLGQGFQNLAPFQEEGTARTKALR